jgi:hypothetical protein
MNTLPNHHGSHGRRKAEEGQWGPNYGGRGHWGAWTIKPTLYGNDEGGIYPEPFFLGPIKQLPTPMTKIIGEFEASLKKCPPRAIVEVHRLLLNLARLAPLSITSKGNRRRPRSGFGARLGRRGLARPRAEQDGYIPNQSTDWRDRPVVHAYGLANQPGPIRIIRIDSILPDQPVTLEKVGVCTDRLVDPLLQGLGFWRIGNLALSICLRDEIAIGMRYNIVDHATSSEAVAI